MNALDARTNRTRAVWQTADLRLGQSRPGELAVEVAVSSISGRSLPTEELTCRQRRLPESLFDAVDLTMGIPWPARPYLPGPKIMGDLIAGYCVFGQAAQYYEGKRGGEGPLRVAFGS